MSLSFVSSSVLTSTDGISHNEETQIKSTETEAVRGKQQQGHKPLFEQLRSNQEDEDTKREEFQRSIMRGTLALDEDDCAHLDTIQKQRKDRENAVKANMEEELALFRAAKADRGQSQLIEVKERDEHNQMESPGEGACDVSTVGVLDEPKRGPLSCQHPENKVQPTIMPKIVVKRRRRRQQEVNKIDSQEAQKEGKKQKMDQINRTNKDEVEEEEKNGLDSLLGDYGSSDGESE